MFLCRHPPLLTRMRARDGCTHAYRRKSWHVQVCTLVALWAVKETSQETLMSSLTYSFSETRQLSTFVLTDYSIVHCFICFTVF